MTQMQRETDRDQVAWRWLVNQIDLPHTEELSQRLTQLIAMGEQVALEAAATDGGFWGRAAARENIQRKQAEALVQRLLHVARGCHDYGGGYRTPDQAEIFHHGIATVITALEHAAKNDPGDSQVNALERIGSQKLA